MVLLVPVVPLVLISSGGFNGYGSFGGLHKTNVSRLNDYIHVFKEFTTHNLDKGDITSVNHHDNLD